MKTYHPMTIAPEHDQWIMYLSERAPCIITVLPEAWINPGQICTLSGTSCAMMVPPPAPVPLSEPLFI